MEILRTKRNVRFSDVVILLATPYEILPRQKERKKESKSRASKDNSYIQIIH